jgi:hypothetical protein
MAVTSVCNEYWILITVTIGASRYLSYKLHLEGAVKEGISTWIPSKLRA